MTMNAEKTDTPGGDYYADAEAVPQFSGGKQGHMCCGCCCDVSRLECGALTSFLVSFESQPNQSIKSISPSI
jgi:hypothetical protein